MEGRNLTWVQISKYICLIIAKNKLRNNSAFFTSCWPIFPWHHPHFPLAHTSTDEQPLLLFQQTCIHSFSPIKRVITSFLPVKLSSAISLSKSFKEPRNLISRMGCQQNSPFKNTLRREWHNGKSLGHRNVEVCVQRLSDIRSNCSNIWVIEKESRKHLVFKMCVSVWDPLRYTLRQRFKCKELV